MRPVSLWYLRASFCLALLWFVQLPQGELTSAFSRAENSIRYGEFLSARIATPGEVQKYTFEAQPGEVVTLILENQTSGGLALALYDPSDQLVTRSVGPGDRELVNVALALPGGYTVRVTGQEAAVGDYELGLFSNASLSVLTPTTIGPGQVVGHRFDVEGAYALFSVPGAANEVLTLFIDTRLNGGLEARLFGPDGRQVAALNQADAADDLLLESQLLPASGTYLLLVNPHGSSTGDVVVAAYAGSEYSHSMPAAIGAGELRTGSLGVGEQAFLRFAGMAGERVVVHADHWAGGSFYLRLFDPLGIPLASRLAPAGNGVAELEATLPEDGDYLVVFDPYRDVVGEYTVALYGTPAGVEPTPTLIAPGESASGSVEEAGQQALYTFDAAANQEVTLAVDNNLSDGLTLLMISPSGEVVGRDESTSAGADQLLMTYTHQAGRYLVVITPRHGATGSYRLAFYSQPNEAVGAVPLDYGDTLAGTGSDSGDHGIYRFDGRAGQTITVFADSALDGGFDLRLFDPNGQLIADQQRPDRGGSAVLENVTLPMNGAYLVALDPVLGATGAWEVTVYNTAGTNVISPKPLVYEVPATSSISKPRGQVFYRFTGTQGDEVSVDLESALSGGVAVRLIAPTGQQLAAQAIPTAEPTVALENIVLPVTGEYLIVVDPLHEATGSFSVEVTRDGTVDVSPSPSDYVVATSPAGRRAARGQSVSYEIALAPRDGFSGPVEVQFDPTSTPPDASIFLDEKPITLPGSVTLTVYVGAATPRGDYALRLVATSGSSQQGLSLKLHVLGRLDWVVTPSVAQVAAGHAISLQGLLAHADGGSGTIILTADPATVPPNARIAFAPTVLTTGSGNITVTVRTAPTTPPGDYTLKLRATVDSDLQSIARVLLRVRPLTAGPDPLIFLPLLKR
ncbi:MAG: PPC domain-containing protein [Ardenticatenaceae bacterium]|nr:PPC domain-containing protein [Ardenticatenaceae bacterium]HBY97835.1 hypothetical protein [Chloroflexota bacterium]